LLPDGAERPIAFDSYVLSKDESKILLACNMTRQYRHSYLADYYVWDRDFETLAPLTLKGKVIAPHFSPDGSKISFVFKNNLYIKDFETGEEYAVTTDGEKNEIINGVADWVYEEEFIRVRYHDWSVDGKHLAYIKFNEKEVPEFTMQRYGSLYPENIKFKYPKAGEKNSTVSVHMYNVDSAINVNVGLSGSSDQYIPRIKWTKNHSKLAILRMNRHQNELEMLFADAHKGAVTSILVERNKRYIDINDHWMFLNDQKHFLWVSEMDGYKHVYLYDISGKLVRQITKGEFDVTDVYGYDSREQKLYYQSSEETALERYVYSIDIKGKNNKKLGEYIGWCSAKFNKTFDYFVHTHSDVSSPYRVTVNMSLDGSEVRVLEDNEGLKELLKDYRLSYPEFFKFKTSEQVELNGYMIKPTDFNPRKKYPVLMYVYGGPGSQMVKNQWNHQSLYHQYLANMGYIIACVDNRGTGGRGEEFKKSTYLNLGKYETIDQIEAAKYLANLSYVDKFRIGIWGWSYGGYMAALCMTKGADVFKAGIAVAPVSNWRYYDTIYTERYLRTPQENPEGYDENSPVNFVEKLKGNFMLVHGMADDNVHLQNSTALCTALVNENKDFDIAFYPDKAHGISGGITRLHLFTKMANYLKENL